MYLYRTVYCVLGPCPCTLSGHFGPDDYCSILLMVTIIFVATATPVRWVLAERYVGLARRIQLLLRRYLTASTLDRSNFFPEESIVKSLKTSTLFL